MYCVSGSLLLIATTLFIIQTSLANARSQAGGKAIRLPTTIDRVYYHGDEVLLWRDPLQPARWYFTPLPIIHLNSTQCVFNPLTQSHELFLVVSLSTPDLLDFLRQHLCRTERCDVSLSPARFIRLMQKQPRNDYQLDGRWHTLASLDQSIKFVIQIPSIAACDRALATCPSSSFAVRYSFHNQAQPDRSSTQFGPLVSHEHSKRIEDGSINQPSLHPQADVYVVPLRCPPGRHSRKNSSESSAEMTNILSKSADVIDQQLAVHEGEIVHKTNSIGHPSLLSLMSSRRRRDPAGKITTSVGILKSRNHRALSSPESLIAETNE